MVHLHCQPETTAALWLSGTGGRRKGPQRCPRPAPRAYRCAALPQDGIKIEDGMEAANRVTGNKVIVLDCAGRSTVITGVPASGRAHREL